jgi:hypothetical protein
MALQLFIKRYLGQNVGTGQRRVRETPEKPPENQQKGLAIAIPIRYNIPCCGMIAMKREVAAWKWQVFPWSECQVRKLATSHCITIVYKVETTCVDV